MSWSLVALAGLQGVSSPAFAAPPDEASPTEASPALPAEDRADQPWITRWAPEPQTVDIGAFAGPFFPSPHNKLFQFRPGEPGDGYEDFGVVAPQVGGRIGYYPIRHFGLEMEGAVMPASVTPRGADESLEAILWTARGSVVGQLGISSITPFVSAGVGALGVTSSPNAVGNDQDLAFHFGGGVKFFLNRQASLRIDVKDVLSRDRVDDGVAHSLELALGIAFTIGRAPPPPPPSPPPDTDADGLSDPDDACPKEVGVPEYDGCPIPDTDEDGFPDPEDACPDQMGTAAYDGCPIPDTDGDGVLDPEDQCVDEPGARAMLGCPIPDSDGDRILDPDDACPSRPEVVNGFEDTDGCPDEVPEAEFTGTIEGFSFGSDQTALSPKATAAIDEVVSILSEYPDLRVEISGHTDARGSESYNMTLSKLRAELVKKRLVDAGVDPARLEIRGAGELEPLDTNLTAEGRANNRRIEFRVVD